MSNSGGHSAGRADADRGRSADCRRPGASRAGWHRPAGGGRGRKSDCDRPIARPILVDTGSAITVDFVSADGVFRGGAIMPGIDMSARALHEFTDLLPLVSLNELGASPPALGISTVTAIRSGLYWGAVGGIRELIARLSASLAQPPALFLTGGAAAHLAGVLGLEARYEPHLVLSGVALAEM